VFAGQGNKSPDVGYCARVRKMSHVSAKRLKGVAERLITTLLNSLLNFKVKEF